ncbi:hypothetical protein SFR_0649 [Streptomyces sp. FR-008]|nr:hypothetical protein SFR_0649 [Streptomyces sp. FR-008]
MNGGAGRAARTPREELPAPGRHDSPRPGHTPLRPT